MLERGPRIYTPDLKPDIAQIDIGALDWSRFPPFRPGASRGVEVAPVEHGVVVRDALAPEGMSLAFSWSEWDAFVAGVESGACRFPERGYFLPPRGDGMPADVDDTAGMA